MNYLPVDLGWRIGFGLGAVLAVVGLWARFAIPESPRWLVAHGRGAEAEHIVRRVEDSVAREKGITLEPVATVSALGAERHSFLQSVQELSSRYLGRVSLACALNFAQASVVYGIMSLLAMIILPAVKVPAQQMPVTYFIGNVAATGGGVVAALLLDSWGRKNSVLSGYVLTTLAMIYLYFAGSANAVLIGYSLVQFAVTWAYIAAYVATAEILPVRNRATGLGISVAAGRVGAFLAPILLSGVFTATRTPGLALLTLTAMTLPGPVAALIWYFRGVEGRRCGLEQICDEMAA